VSPVPINANTVLSGTVRIPVPSYDRSRITAGIVHLGGGAFHRAHQAAYLDRLMNNGKAFDWGICDVGTTAADRAVKEALQAQDCLYTLLVKHNDGSCEPRIVGSIVDYLLLADDPDLVIETIARRTTKIVSLTVTEGGYNIDEQTGVFDLENIDVKSDLQSAIPQSIFGVVVEGLRRRRARGFGPLSVLSCDNVQGNGQVARTAFTTFARAHDPDLADWVEHEVSFPNTMVDRITPATTELDRRNLRAEFGIEDRCPVVCEAYTQWVLEDGFVSGHPALDEVGAQFVGDVGAYELMKLRLLNGAHQAIAYFGYLCGHRKVHEAASDSLLQTFLRAYMDHEVTPTLPSVPGVDLRQYKTTLITRFCNPHIDDTLERLCAHSSDRIPKFVLPVIHQQLSNGGEIKRAAAIIASWARYAEGVDELGQPIVVIDRQRQTLKRLARQQRNDPLAFLANRALFSDLADNSRFTSAFQSTMISLHQRGIRATIQALL
jgi:mannitol 2-dehydrogenase